MFDDEEVLKYHRSNNTPLSGYNNRLREIHFKGVFLFNPSFTSSLTETSYFYENSITIFLYGFSRYSSTDGFLSWLPTRIYIKRINKNNKKINLSMRASRKNLPYYIWVWDPLHLTLFHFSHWSNGLLHGIFFPQTKLRQWCYTKKF